MGERAFTPGPWFVTDDDSVGQAVVRNADIEVCTCWHHCVGSIEKEMRANARLIAAAPALLEALKAVRAFAEAEVENREHAGGSMSDYINEAQEVVDTIDAAISQAEGRDHGCDASGSEGAD